MPKSMKLTSAPIERRSPHDNINNDRPATDLNRAHLFFGSAGGRVLPNLLHHCYKKSKCRRISIRAVIYPVFLELARK
jgi:hypothetical protein